jgi:hypothetical protein
LPASFRTGVLFEAIDFGSLYNSAWVFPFTHELAESSVSFCEVMGFVPFWVYTDQLLPVWQGLRVGVCEAVSWHLARLALDFENVRSLQLVQLAPNGSEWKPRITMDLPIADCDPSLLIWGNLVQVGEQPRAQTILMNSLYLHDDLGGAHRLALRLFFYLKKPIGVYLQHASNPLACFSLAWG